MIKRILTLAIVTLLSCSVKADEGMWVPAWLDSVIGDMQAKGCKLTAEDIYSINKSSLKEATVRFGSGCSAELISPNGLVLTNHHCGYGSIARLSSVENDYLKDGYWAMSLDKELRVPGMTISFFDSMSDVTDEVLNGYNEGMSESEREAIVKANSDAIVERITKGKNGITARVAPLYYGNQYFVYVYKVYRDIRFVGAPPSSIGKFGGDTDNWMWPRHTGDFSIFRIYASPEDNEPADYSENNVPYKGRSFEINVSGIKEGDFTMVYGCPGRTSEYITSAEVEYMANISNPALIALRDMRLEAYKKYMSQDQAVRIMYSSRQAGIANFWKKMQGQTLGVNRLGTVADKRVYEAKFNAWAKGTKYEGVVDSLIAIQERVADYQFAYDYYRESLATIEYLNFLAGGKKGSESFYKNYYQPIDEECFDQLLSAFAKDVPKSLRPAIFDEMMAKYPSVEEFRKAIFSNEQEALALHNALHDYYYTEVWPVVKEMNDKKAVLMRTYMKGQMEFEPERRFYPDANGTLRVSYGKIKGYTPADGIYFYPFSTIDGIIQKDNPNIFDYNIPQRLRDIYASEDYGRWGVNGSVPVCFIADNHTTGGNSGSPTLDANGRLIGINFDRVWEGTMSDVVFDPEFCRNISVDIRYVLFVIDKIGGASHLIDEMILVE